MEKSRRSIVDEFFCFEYPPGRWLLLETAANVLTSAALQCVVVSLPKYGHSYRHHRGILLPSPVIHIVIIVIIVICWILLPSPVVEPPAELPSRPCSAAAATALAPAGRGHEEAEEEGDQEAGHVRICWN